MIRVLWLLLLTGCYLTTAYEPTVCTSYAVEPRSADTVWIHCENWQAMRDSTKCWTNDGEKQACP